MYVCKNRWTFSSAEPNKTDQGEEGRAKEKKKRKSYDKSDYETEKFYLIGTVDNCNFFTVAVFCVLTFFFIYVLLTLQNDTLNIIHIISTRHLEILRALSGKSL